MTVDGNKVAVFASAGLAIAMCAAAGLGFYARATAADRLASNEVRLQEARERLSTAEELANESKSQRAAPKHELLSVPDVVGTLRELNALSTRAGVCLDNQQALKAGLEGKQSFVVSGRGRPQQVCQFLADIETSRRLMVVETGRVFPASGDDIAFEFGIATYHGGGQQ